MKVYVVETVCDGDRRADAVYATIDAALKDYPNDFPADFLKINLPTGTSIRSSYTTDAVIITEYEVQE